MSEMASDDIKIKKMFWSILWWRNCGKLLEIKNNLKIHLMLERTDNAWITVPKTPMDSIHYLKKKISLDVFSIDLSNEIHTHSLLERCHSLKVAWKNEPVFLIIFSTCFLKKKRWKRTSNVFQPARKVITARFDRFWVQ